MFRVTASSVELGNVFALSAGGGAQIPYRVFWRRRDAPVLNNARADATVTVTDAIEYPDDNDADETEVTIAPGSGDPPGDIIIEEPNN